MTPLLLTSPSLISAEVSVILEKLARGTAVAITPTDKSAKTTVVTLALVGNCLKVRGDDHKSHCGD